MFHNWHYSSIGQLPIYEVSAQHWISIKSTRLLKKLLWNELQDKLLNSWRVASESHPLVYDSGSIRHNIATANIGKSVQMAHGQLPFTSMIAINWPTGVLFESVPQTSTCFWENTICASSTQAPRVQPNFLVFRPRLLSLESPPWVPIRGIWLLIFGTF